MVSSPRDPAEGAAQARRPAGEAEAYAALEARVAAIDLRHCDGCSRCAERCTDEIEVTCPEFLRMVEALRGVSAETLARVLAQEKGIPGWEETGIRLCPFLDREENRCVVYPARFLICRLFGHAPWLPCPYGDCPPFEDAVAVMQAYADLERHTLTDWARRTGVALLPQQ